MYARVDFYPSSVVLTAVFRRARARHRSFPRAPTREHFPVPVPETLTRDRATVGIAVRAKRYA